MYSRHNITLTLENMIVKGEGKMERARWNKAAKTLYEHVYYT
jgi:hypothetical protein